MGRGMKYHRFRENVTRMFTAMFTVNVSRYLSQGDGSHALAVRQLKLGKFLVTPAPPCLTFTNAYSLVLDVVHS